MGAKHPIIHPSALRRQALAAGLPLRLRSLTMSKSSVPTTQGQPSTQVSIARAIWFPTPRKGFVGILDIDADGTIYRGAFVAITAWGSLKTLVPSKGKLPG